MRGIVYYLTLAGGLLLLFGLLCLVYWRVPRGPIPWRCVWPGALGAAVAIGDRRLRLPALPHQRDARCGSATSFLFVMIVLVWFYALALILLAGAVVNELRFEGRPAAQDED